jgi:hypothetical protein
MDGGGLDDLHIATGKPELGDQLLARQYWGAPARREGTSRRFTVGSYRRHRDEKQRERHRDDSAAPTDAAGEKGSDPGYIPHTEYLVRAQSTVKRMSDVAFWLT